MKHIRFFSTLLSLSSEEAGELKIHVVPLVVTLEGTSYRESVDIQPDEFYPLLAATHSLPSTSQPSAGDFVETCWHVPNPGCFECQTIHLATLKPQRFSLDKTDHVW